MAEEKGAESVTPEKEIGVASSGAPSSAPAPDIDALLKQLEIAKREVAEFREKVAAANKKKEQAFRKKQEAGKQVAEKISELLGNKKERNNLTKEVRELKKQRDLLNKQIREKVAEIKRLSAEAPQPRGGRGRSRERKDDPLYLKKQIEQLEYKLETQPMGFEAEQKLTKKIKELKTAYEKVKDKVGIISEIRERSKEIDALKAEANKIHRQVQELAKGSQVRHEALLEESTEIDELKKREAELYEEFLQHKKVYQELNAKMKSRVQELQKIKEELNKHNVKFKERQQEEELKTLKERAQEAQEKIKKKQKLTTEDLLAMQGIK